MGPFAYVGAKSTVPGDGECKRKDAAVSPQPVPSTDTECNRFTDIRQLDYVATGGFDFAGCFSSSSTVLSVASRMASVADGASCDSICTLFSGPGVTSFTFAFDGLDSFNCNCYDTPVIIMGGATTCGMDSLYTYGSTIPNPTPSNLVSKKRNLLRNQQTSTLCPDSMTACRVRGVSEAFEVGSRSPVPLVI